jgi:N-acetyl sugar amidotransferase
MEYKECSHCVLDNSVFELKIDNFGQCHVCKMAKARFKQNTAQKLNTVELRKYILSHNKRKGDYDCIIGLSGGVDSAYVAHFLVRKLQLKPLAVHVDGGWNSLSATKNINTIVRSLNLDLHTHVVDWDSMRRLQLSFLKAGVINQDIPQDHAFFTGIFRSSRLYHTKLFVSGINSSSENIQPPSMGPSYIDARHLLSIQRKFDSTRINYNTTSFMSYLFYNNVLKLPRSFHLLNCIEYDKDSAKQCLVDEYGWSDYGRKHSESLFTKFYQDIYLPQKFNFDKRRLHLSSQIVSGQISRKDAILALANPIIDEVEMKNLIYFVSTKLGISQDELLGLVNSKTISHSQYASNEKLWRTMIYIKRLIRA